MARLDIRFIINIMRQNRILYLIILLLLLPACQITRNGTLEISDYKTITKTPITPTTYPTSTLKAKNTSIPTLTSTMIINMSDNHGLITKTPEPTRKLCSPLAEQTLQEIQDIVTDPYDPPNDGSDARHHGTDFAYYRRKDRKTIEGEIIQSILAGRVSAVVGDQLPYGNMLIIESTKNDLPPNIVDQLRIENDESLYTLYAHMTNQPELSISDRVLCGQNIGNVGKTGYNIVNPHLHLEIRIGPSGQVFEAGMAYYDTQSTEIERANYELWRTSGVFRHLDPIIVMNEYIQNQNGDEFLQ
jgi:murein DD-endopeptidase MepM/ murein hydrolase activator NlpD